MGFLWPYFSSYLSTVLNAVLYSWPLTLVIALYTLTVITIWLKKTPRPKIHWVSLVCCFPMSFIIWLFGVLYGVDENWQPHPYMNLANTVILSVLTMQLIWSGLLLYRSQVGARLLISSLLIWAMLFSLQALFVASMSISGKFL